MPAAMTSPVDAVRVIAGMAFTRMLRGRALWFSGLLLAVPTAAALKIIIGHAWRHYVLGEPLDEIEARWESEEERVPGGVVERVGLESATTPEEQAPPSAT